MSAPTIARPAVDTYTWDGVTYDRKVPLQDCHGTVWRWTRTENEAGEPLLAASDGLGVMPLPDLYHDLLPLRPLLPRQRSGLAELVSQRECAAAPCGRPARPGTAYCSPACRDIDDPHDLDDYEGDDA